MLNTRKLPDFLTVVLTFVGLTFAVKKVMNAGLILLFIRSVWHLIKHPREILSEKKLLGPALLLTLPVVLTLLFAAIQGSFRVDKFDESFRYFLAAPCLFYLFSTMQARHENCLIHVFGFSWLVILLTGLLLPGWAEDRFDTKFVDVNTLGMAACIGTFLSAYKTIRSQQWQHRLFWLLCLASSGFVLVAAGSRSSWLAAAVCLAIGVWCMPQTKLARLKILLAASLAVGLVFTVSEKPRQRVTEMINGLAQWSSNQEDDRSSPGVRLDLYKGGLHLIAAQPLIGYTLEEEQAAVRGERQLQLELRERVSYHWLGSGVHSQYIDRGINQGMAGLLMSLCLFWIPALSAIWMISSKLRSEEDHSLLVLCAVGLLGFGIHGFFHNIGLKFLCSFHAMLIALYYVKARSADFAGHSSQ